LVFRDIGAGFTQVADVDDTFLTWNDAADPAPDGVSVTYRIYAYDKCSTPNVSAEAETLPVVKGCANTPGKPSPVTLDPTATDVSWTKPAFNDDGVTPLTDLAGYWVYRSLDGGLTPYSLVATNLPGDTNYSETPPGGADVIYAIFAFDKCSPTPKFSYAYSNLEVPVTTDPCIDSPGDTSATMNAAWVVVGDSVRVTWTRPTTNDVTGTEFVDGAAQVDVAVGWWDPLVPNPGAGCPVAPCWHEKWTQILDTDPTEYIWDTTGMSSGSDITFALIYSDTCPPISGGPNQTWSIWPFTIIKP
jgi:hypothetical protein